MNPQVNSIIRTVLKIAGALLAQRGLTQAANLVNSEDVIGLLLVLAGVVMSWWEHNKISVRFEALTDALTEKILSEINSTKTIGGGGNATGDVPAEPTAVPAKP